MRDTIQKILEMAVYAPSGDNSQPWKFVAKDNEIKIFNIPDRDNFYLNFRQSGSYVAHGALIENIVITASQHGYKADISLFPDSQNNDLVAVIKLTQTSPTEERFYPLIKERVTNRKPYENKKLSEGQKRSFLNAPEEVGGEGKIILVDEEDKMRLIGEASSAMEQIALETDFLHKLFFGDIVWTEEEEQKSADFISKRWNCRRRQFHRFDIKSALFCSSSSVQTISPKKSLCRKSVSSAICSIALDASPINRILSSSSTNIIFPSPPTSSGAFRKLL